MKHTFRIQIIKVRTMTLITSKIKTNITSTIIAPQELAIKAMETKAKEITTQRTATGKASQRISHVEWTCQQGTAVQDTRSTETSITVLG